MSEIDYSDTEEGLRIKLTELEKRKFKNRSDYNGITNLQKKIRDIETKKKEIIIEFNKHDHLESCTVQPTKEFKILCTEIENQIKRDIALKKAKIRYLSDQLYKESDQFSIKHETSMLSLFKTINAENNTYNSSYMPENQEIIDQAKPDYFSLIQESTFVGNNDRLESLYAKLDILELESEEHEFDKQKLLYKAKQLKNDIEIQKRRKRRNESILKIIRNNFENFQTRKIISTFQTDIIDNRLAMEKQAFQSVRDKKDKILEKRYLQKEQSEYIKNSLHNECGMTDVKIDKFNDKKEKVKINFKKLLEEDKVTPQLQKTKANILKYQTVLEETTRFIAKSRDNHLESIEQLQQQQNIKNIARRYRPCRRSIMNNRYLGDVRNLSLDEYEKLQETFKAGVVEKEDVITAYHRSMGSDHASQLHKFNNLQVERVEKTNLLSELTVQAEKLRKDMTKMIIQQANKSNLNAKKDRIRNQSMIPLNPVCGEDTGFFSFPDSSLLIETNEKINPEGMLFHQKIDNGKKSMPTSRTKLNKFTRQKSCLIDLNDTSNENRAPLQYDYKNKMLPQMDAIIRLNTFFINLFLGFIMAHIRFCQLIGYIDDNSPDEAIPPQITDHCKKVKEFLSNLIYKEVNIHRAQSKFTELDTVTEDFYDYMKLHKKRDKEKCFNLIKDTLGGLANEQDNITWIWFIQNTGMINYIYDSKDLRKKILYYRNVGQCDIGQIGNNLIVDLHDLYLSNIDKIFQFVKYIYCEVSDQVIVKNEQGYNQSKLPVEYQYRPSHLIQKKEFVELKGGGFQRKMSLRNIDIGSRLPEPFTAPIGRFFKFGKLKKRKLDKWELEPEDIEDNHYFDGNVNPDEYLSIEDQEKFRVLQENDLRDKPYQKESILFMNEIKKHKKKKNVLYDSLYRMNDNKKNTSILNESIHQDSWIDSKLKSNIDNPALMDLPDEKPSLRNIVSGLNRKTEKCSKSQDFLKKLSKIKILDELPCQNKPYAARAYLINTLYRVEDLGMMSHNGQLNDTRSNILQEYNVKTNNTTNTEFLQRITKVKDKSNIGHTSMEIGQRAPNVLTKGYRGACSSDRLLKNSKNNKANITFLGLRDYRSPYANEALGKKAVTFEPNETFQKNLKGKSHRTTHGYQTMNNSPKKNDDLISNEDEYDRQHGNNRNQGLNESRRAIQGNHNYYQKDDGLDNILTTVYTDNKYVNNENIDFSKFNQKVLSNIKQDILPKMCHCLNKTSLSVDKVTLKKHYNSKKFEESELQRKIPSIPTLRATNPDNNTQHYKSTISNFGTGNRPMGYSRDIMNNNNPKGNFKYDYGFGNVSRISGGGGKDELDILTSDLIKYKEDRKDSMNTIKKTMEASLSTLLTDKEKDPLSNIYAPQSYTSVSFFGGFGMNKVRNNRKNPFK